MNTITQDQTNARQSGEYLRQAAINGIHYSLRNPSFLHSAILPRARQHMRTSEGRYLIDAMAFECGGSNPLQCLNELFAKLEAAEGLRSRHHA